MAKILRNFGSVEFGEKLVLGFQGGPTTDSPSDWKPGMFDVVDPETGEFLIRQSLVTQYVTAPPDPDLYFVTIDTLQEVTDGDLFAPRKQYLLNVYEDVTDPPIHTDNQLRGVFYVGTSVKAMLDRILGLLGENQVLDSFQYDQPGNITNLRLRLFSSSTNAENATQGATGPEVGETAQYDVVQDHELPRSLRSFHRSYRSYIEESRE